MYSVKDLSVFIRAAHSRSFAEAASSLGLTASAVGKVIQKIEDRHTIRLFKRNTRNIFLTEEGEILLHHAMTIVGEFDNAVNAFSELKKSEQGKLKISIPNIDSLFGELLAEFMRTHPHTELEVDVNDEHSDIIKDGFDAVIRFGESADSRLYARTIGTLTMGVFHAPHYSPAETLTANRFLLYRFPSTGKTEHWDGALPFDPRAVRHASVVNSIPLIRRLCLAGGGLAWLPEAVCREDLLAGRLLRMAGSETTQRTVNIVWPDKRNTGLRLRAFIQFFAREFMNHPMLKPPAVVPGADEGMSGPASDQT